jgi:uncharacterized protein
MKSMIPKEQIDTLIRIQELEKQACLVNAKLNDLPKKLEALDLNLEASKESENAMESELKDLKKKYRAMEEDIRLSQSQEKKNQEKLRSVKTNKEYQSSLKEIEDLKKKMSVMEDNMLLILEQIDHLESLVSEKKKETETLSRKIDSYKKAIQTEAEESKNNLTNIKGKIEEAIKKVDPALFARYNWVQQKVGRLAIVSVVKAVCQGCHLNIPPQMYNELHRGDTIRFCPHCQRMIYWNGGSEQYKRSPGLEETGPEESPNTKGQGAP